MKIRRSIILFIFSLPFSVFAQCNTFMKAKCNPILKPYLSSGREINSTLLSEDKAEMFITFYEGLDYRITLCSQKELGNVEMRLKDGKNDLIFSGKVQDSNFWDIKVASTQVMTIEVITPAAQTSDNLDKSGCVSLMVGFKPY